MYREFYYAIAVLAVLGISISFLLAPSKKELALMNLEDKNYERSFEQYKKLIDEGDMSVGVVMPLSRLYIQYGDIESAIALIESFVKIYPESFDARKQLGILYKYSQQPDDYLNNLEYIYKTHPSAEILRELSDIYNYNGEYNKQIIILNDLLYNRKYNSKEKDFSDLAYLYGTQNDYKSAINTLDYLLQLKNWMVQPDVLQLFVSLLIDNKQDDDALKAANEYVKKDPNVTLKNIARLSEIMRQKNKLELALKFLRPYVKNIDSSADILVEFINLQLKLNSEKIITGYENEIPSLIASIKGNEDISSKEKRSIAYTLLDVNMVEEAKILFFELAKNASPKSPDIEQIFYLWGADIGADKLEWAKKRALGSKNEELYFWLKYLNDARQYRLVIDIAENYPDKDNEAFSRYLEAVALSGDKEKLSQILEEEVGKKPDVRNLRSLAKFAIEENLNNIAESALTRLIKLSPDDLMAVQYLSKLKYFEGQISEAKNILEHFLKNNEGNYEINYYYAEILWSEKRFSYARTYFKKSYNQIVAMKKKDFFENFLEANILVRLNETKKAVAKFRNLVNKYPGNKHLRADYVNLLMELGEYEKANKVLGAISF